MNREQQLQIENEERPIFEGWYKRVFGKAHWPNPGSDGRYYFEEGHEFAGQYHNRHVNDAWQGWLARALLAQEKEMATAKARMEAYKGRSGL